MTVLLLAVIFLGYISLGIPDSLIGAAWPVMYKEFSVPISYLSSFTSIIYVGTIIASFSSAYVIKKPLLSVRRLPLLHFLVSPFQKAFGCFISAVFLSVSAPVQ